MKFYRLLIIIALMLGLASCGASRRAKKSSSSISEKTRIEQLKNELQSEQSESLRRLLAEAYSWEGVPYLWGGETKKGVDCSGLTMKVFQNSLGIKLPRNSAKQREACTDVSRSSLMPGDLVFFNTKSGGPRHVVNHVGLYVGDGTMIHASSHGVMLSGLEEPYYQRHYLACGRVPELERMKRAETKKAKEVPAVIDAPAEPAVPDTVAEPSAIQLAIAEMMRRYPRAELKDIYKSFFQDHFGPGHIIADQTQARSYLDWELAQPAAYTQGPLYEPTGAEGNYYRVDLRVVTDGLVPYEEFFDAFVASAEMAKDASVADFAAYWQQVQATAIAMGLDSLPNFEADARRIDEQLAAGKYVGHHSEAFQQAYDPHYRIIARPIFLSKILPRLQ